MLTSNKISQSKVLITGANGFVGSNLCQFLQDYFNIGALIREKSNLKLFNEITFNNKKDKIDIISCDYKNFNQLKDIISEYDVVIHTAGLTTGENFEKLYDANVLLTEQIVEILNLINKDIHFIYISSQAATGVSINKTPKKESDKEIPVTWYGKSKLLAEKVIRKNLLRNWTIIRPASVFGPGDVDFFHYFELLNRHLIPLPSKSNVNEFSYIYIYDLCSIICKSIKNKSVYNEILNAADPSSCTTEHFIRIMSSAVKYVNRNNINIDFMINIEQVILKPLSFFSEAFWFLQYQISGSKKFPIFNRQKILEINSGDWLLDTEKSQRLLNFLPENSLFENLTSTFKWYKENNKL